MCVCVSGQTPPILTVYYRISLPAYWDIAYTVIQVECFVYTFLLIPFLIRDNVQSPIIRTRLK